MKGLMIKHDTLSLEKNPPSTRKIKLHFLKLSNLIRIIMVFYDSKLYR